MKTKTKDILIQDKIFIQIALITGLILLIPLTAMQFTNEVNWSFGDFLIMGTLIFGISSLFVIAARRIEKKHRTITAIIFTLAFLWLWVELAVGLFTNWGS